MGLRQLTSPVVSAAAVADWLTTGYINPDVPVGLIELLLSPPPAGTAAGDGATMENIKTGFDPGSAAAISRRTISPCSTSAGTGWTPRSWFCWRPTSASRGRGSGRTRSTSTARSTPWASAGRRRSVLSRRLPVDAHRAVRQRGRVAAQPLRSPTTLSFPPRDAPVYLATPFGQKSRHWRTGSASSPPPCSPASAAWGRRGGWEPTGHHRLAEDRLARPDGPDGVGQNQRLHCARPGGREPSADGPALLAGHRVCPHRCRLPADGRPEIRRPELHRGPGVVAPPARPEPRPVGAGAGR